MKIQTARTIASSLPVWLRPRQVADSAITTSEQIMSDFSKVAFNIAPTLLQLLRAASGHRRQRQPDRRVMSSASASCGHRGTGVCCQIATLTDCPCFPSRALANALLSVRAAMFRAWRETWESIMASATNVFKHLRDIDAAKSFETGHPGYDRFFTAAKEYHGPLEGQDTFTREELLRELPFLTLIEAEHAESLGRAMFINAYTAYAVRGWGDSWNVPYELQPKMRFATRAFDAFTRPLPHARLSVADVEALLREIPVALFHDQLVLFSEMFFRSFSRPLPASLEGPLNRFVDDAFERPDFFHHGVLAHSDAEAIIGRHLQFMAVLGRAPESHPFYRERSRVFDLARRQAAEMVPKLGAVHARYATAMDNGRWNWFRRDLPSGEVRQFQAAVDGASPSELGQMVADQCLLTMRPYQLEVDRWQHAGVPFQPAGLDLRQLALDTAVQRKMQLPPEQACVILEYMAIHGSIHFQKIPTLTYRLARTLSRSLPTRRPDLERLVKQTLHNTSQPTKELLLDTLRAERRGVFERTLRGYCWKLFSPEDKPEMWAEWVADKRASLIEQIGKTRPIGLAAPRSAQLPDWGRLNGQLYHLDAVGYAKRIAQAQSGGADVSAALKDLRQLSAMARNNLAVLEASAAGTASSPQVTMRSIAPSRPPRIANTVPNASLFGLRQLPTTEQLIDCERRTLAMLDHVVARIDLIRRCPALVSFERTIHTVPDTWVKWSDVMRTMWLDAPFPSVVPAGLCERVDAIDFNLLEGPYLFDTEPRYTETEFAAWRAAVLSLYRVPVASAAPALQRIAEKCFATHLTPAWSYAKRGYRAEELGRDALWALEMLPRKAGLEIVSNLWSRVYPEPLRNDLRDVVASIERGPMN